MACASCFQLASRGWPAECPGKLARRAFSPTQERDAFSRKQRGSGNERAGGIRAPSRRVCSAELKRWDGNAVLARVPPGARWSSDGRPFTIPTSELNTSLS